MENNVVSLNNRKYTFIVKDSPSGRFYQIDLVVDGYSTFMFELIGKFAFNFLLKTRLKWAKQRLIESYNRKCLNPPKYQQLQDFLNKD